jgi:cytochrome c peroxidase
MRFKFFKINKLIYLLFVFFIYCKRNDTSTLSPDTIIADSLTPYSVSYPNYFPILNVPYDNRLTVEGIELGRRLYYDTILSNNGKSCSSCHNSQEGFSTFASNSLPHINLGWNTNFLWDGKITGKLEDIMQFEIDVFFNTTISKLNNSTLYKNQFKTVYNVETISSKNVAYALAQFFRVMVSANSLCDKYLQHKANFTTSQLNGLVLFTTEKGDCFHCHSLGLFTDNKFRNNGIDSVFIGVDLGRYNVTTNINDIGLFKTPTLRNIELTAPYMHDGRFQTLEEVIEHYNSGVRHSSTLDPIMTKPNKIYGLGLTITEKQDLVAFLKTLTDTSFIQNPLLQNP